jgi:hypothetical protein
MKQPGVLLVLITFVVGVSFVVGSEQYKNGTMQTTTLTGLNETSSLGDPDGVGMLKFTVKADEGKFCYDLNVSTISDPTSATLNIGARGISGAVLTTLKTPTQGSSADCVTLDADRMADIVRNPGSYYVNVLNAEFPEGAIRGQLGK